METFRVESVRLETTFERAFEYVAEPANLLAWTHAFKAVQNGRAILTTPAGSVEVGLKVKSSRSEGTIDWHMTFPAEKWPPLIRGWCLSRMDTPSSVSCCSRRPFLWNS